MPGERWSKMPESLLMDGDLCAECVALFAVLDLEQGDRGRPFKGVRSLAYRLGWGNDRVYRHLRHLESRGFVSVERESYRKVRFRVLNPARGADAIVPATGTMRFRQQEQSVPATGTLSSSLLSSRSAGDSKACVAAVQASNDDADQRVARALSQPTLGAIRRRNGTAP